jgi:hypothetical protein
VSARSPAAARPLLGMTRSLAFGATAALGVVVWQLLLSPWLGAGSSFALYALLCACAFPVAIAPSLRAALRSLSLSVPLGAVVLLLAPEAVSGLLGGGLMVALARSVMYHAPVRRLVVLELALFTTGLLLARLAGSGTPFGLGLGLWTYFLVQSSYFLLLRPSEKATEPLGDAFEVAHERAQALLGRRA